MELDSDRFSLLGMLHLDLQRLVNAHPHILSAVVIVEEASILLAGIKLFCALSVHRLLVAKARGQ